MLLLCHFDAGDTAVMNMWLLLGEYCDCENAEHENLLCVLVVIVIVNVIVTVIVVIVIVIVNVIVNANVIIEL